jgi:flavorubredoxin
MNALIVFFSLTHNTEKVAEAIAEELRNKKVSVSMEKITVLKEKDKNKNKKKNKKDKKKEVKIQAQTLDWKKFDLIFVGTPVHGFQPAEAITVYLRQCSNVSGKNIGVFVTCSAFPGKTIKKISGILSSHGGKLKDWIVLKSLFGLNEKKLGEAKKFASSFLP